MLLCYNLSWSPSDLYTSARAHPLIRKATHMEPVGAFTFVLHSHLPYARMAGRWPHGEEWIHEASTETYIPLLNALNDLKEEGVKYKITIGMTPILVEQLSDTDVLANLDSYLDEKIFAAKSDIERFKNEDEPDEHMAYLAQWYTDLFEEIKRSFDDRYQRDIIGAFKQ